jgi:DNA-directed RNA polymerase specialized sigma24 family protein
MWLVSRPARPPLPLMMAAPGSTEVADELTKLRPRIERVAAGMRPLSGGIDASDLTQVGLIAAWRALEKGVVPSMKIIEKHMTNEIRRDARQSRQQAGKVVGDVIEEVDARIARGYLDEEATG